MNPLVATKKNPIKKVKQAIAHPKKVNRYKMLIQKKFLKKEETEPIKHNSRQHKQKLAKSIETQKPQNKEVVKSSRNTEPNFLSRTPKEMWN